MIITGLQMFSFGLTQGGDEFFMSVSYNKVSKILTFCEIIKILTLHNSFDIIIIKQNIIFSHFQEE